MRINSNFQDPTSTPQKGVYILFLEDLEISVLIHHEAK